MTKRTVQGIPTVRMALIGRLPETVPPPRVVERRNAPTNESIPQVLDDEHVMLPLPPWGRVVVASRGLAVLAQRLPRIWERLTPDGGLWLWASPDEVHYVKVLADGLLGRQRFMGEIVWAGPVGPRPGKGWPAGHRLLLWYARNPRDYVFREETVERIPYMAPRLVGPTKARRGKRPTDVWWAAHFPEPGTVPQPPAGFWRRLVVVHTFPGDAVLVWHPPKGLESALKALGRVPIPFPD